MDRRARHTEGDVAVTVDGEPWRRVPTLKSAGPDDRVFTLVVNDEGAWVVFGDGEHGARPATGSSLTVTYRGSRRYVGVMLQEGRVLLDADWNEEPVREPCMCGVYRATVVDNADPMSMKRLKVRVPEVMGAQEAWAVACLPACRTGIPEVGAMVWVAFEAGDSARPVWLGTAVVGR